MLCKSGVIWRGVVPVALALAAGWWLMYFSNPTDHGFAFASFFTMMILFFTWFSVAMGTFDE